jgi:hypothetical protein
MLRVDKSPSFLSVVEPDDLTVKVGGDTLFADLVATSLQTVIILACSCRYLTSPWYLLDEIRILHEKRKVQYCAPYPL